MKFESSLNPHCRRGVAACSSASEAVRGCQEEGCEEEGYEEEGGDEGERKREGYRGSRRRLSLICVASVSRSASSFPVVMTSLISHIVRYQPTLT